MKLWKTQVNLCYFTSPCPHLSFFPLELPSLPQFEVILFSPVLASHLLAPLLAVLSPVVLLCSSSATGPAMGREALGAITSQLAGSTETQGSSGKQGTAASPGTQQHSFSPCHAQGDKQDAENTNSSSNTSWALAGVLLPFFSPPVVPRCPRTQQLSPEIKLSPQCHQRRLQALLTGTLGGGGQRGEERVLPRFLFHSPFVPGLHHSHYVKSLQNLSELKASASPTGTRGLINRLHRLLIASKKQPSIFL